MKTNNSKLHLKLVFFFFLLLFVLTFSRSIFAQTLDPNQRYASCDQCGLCQFNGTVMPTPQSWQQCKDCLYPDANNLGDTLRIEGADLPPTPYQGSMYTIIGCLKTDAGEFTQQLVVFFMRIVGGIAFLFLIYGAIIVASSRSNPERLNYGKRVVYASIAGLLIVLGATFIIRIIASNILTIPGFGG